MQNAERAFSQALIGYNRHRPAPGVGGDACSFTCTAVWGGPHDARRVGCKPCAKRASLLDAERAQTDEFIVFLNRNCLGAACKRVYACDVPDAFCVSDQEDIVGPNLWHAECIPNIACSLTGLAN